MNDDEMMADLAAADAAGDTALAQHIAGQIKSARQPPDTHGTLAKVAHYGAKALPAVGGVGGAMLAGAPAIPTGPGALLTGAAGAGLGAGAGRALQKSIDQYLGYEQPDLKRDLIDVGTTGLRDATYATGAGVATAGLAKAAPLLSGALKSGAQAVEQRILTNKINPFSKSKPISPEALDEAAGRGAFKFFGTSAGAAKRLEAQRKALGADYGRIISQLEANGIQGADAQAIAQKYIAAQGQTTMNPAVPNVYRSAAEMVGNEPTVNGRLSLSQMEELKRSAQGMAKSAYKQLQPTEVGKAHEAVASTMRQGTEDEIAQQSANAPQAVQDLAAQFVPAKQHLGNVIEASDVAREGMARAAKRSAFSIIDKGAALSELARTGSLPRALATGLGTHLLHTRGPSSAAVLLRGSSELAGAFPSIAPQAERAAMSLAPVSAERSQIEALIQALLKKSTPAPQLADASQ